VLAGLFLVAAPVGGKEPGSFPPELALVPADTDLVVSARVAKLWASDVFRSYRKLAGPHLEAMADLFGFRPDEIDRLTVFRRDVESIVLVTTVGPARRKKILEVFAPEAVQRKVAGKACYRNEESWTGVAFLDDRTVAVGPVDLIEALVAADVGKEGPQTAVLRLAVEHDLVVGMTGTGEDGLRALGRLLPAPFRKGEPLFRAGYGVVTADVQAGQGAQLRLRADLRYPTDALARDAVGAARHLQQAGGKQLEQLRAEWKTGGPGVEGANAALAAVDGAVRRLKIQGEGQELTASVSLPAQDTGMLCMFFCITEHSSRDPLDPSGQGRKHLAELARALLAYHKDKGRLPPHALYSHDGKTPLLSWRVLVLPYLGDEGKKLYRQFHLDEPWDSPHNIRLVRKMPAVFAAKEWLQKSTATTAYQVLTGPGTLFDGPRGRPLADATDGPAYTILIAQGFDRVPWTKPQDLVYAPRGPLPHLGSRSGWVSGFLAAFADGEVRTLPAPGHGGPDPNKRVWTPQPGFDPAPLRALITRAGGEKVSCDSVKTNILPFHPPGENSAAPEGKRFFMPEEEP
jgi:hypothetical protein